MGVTACDDRTRRTRRYRAARSRQTSDMGCVASSLPADGAAADRAAAEAQRARTLRANVAERDAAYAAWRRDVGALVAARRFAWEPSLHEAVVLAALGDELSLVLSSSWRCCVTVTRGHAGLGELVFPPRWPDVWQPPYAPSPEPTCEEREQCAGAVAFAVAAAGLFVADAAQRDVHRAVIGVPADAGRDVVFGHFARALARGAPAVPPSALALRRAFAAARAEHAVVAPLRLVGGETLALVTDAAVAAVAAHAWSDKAMIEPNPALLRAVAAWASDEGQRQPGHTVDGAEAAADTSPPNDDPAHAA
jgi:hypothetical protein